MKLTTTYSLENEHGLPVITWKKIKHKYYKYELCGRIEYDTKIKVHNFGYFNPFVITSTSGYLILLEGFRWNGSDVVFDTKECMRASAFHDVLINMVRAGWIDNSYIPRINDIYRDICMADGMGKAQYMWRRWGLKKYWNRKVKK